MKFTFGIITGGSNDEGLGNVIQSIENQNIPEYEIIIVGGKLINRKNVIHIPFDESIVHMWITRKKNLITQKASYENVVYMHDYIKLEDGWYNGFLKFGENFKVCMTQIKNVDGTRYRDWTLWAADKYVQSPRFLIPYDLTHLSKIMYISGAYWVAKRHIMKEFPLDESLSWGQSEDVEWSFRFREKYEFSMNPYSSVKLMKQKSLVFQFPTEEDVKKLRGLTL